MQEMIRISSVLPNPPRANPLDDVARLFSRLSLLRPSCTLARIRIPSGCSYRTLGCTPYLLSDAGVPALRPWGERDTQKRPSQLGWHTEGSHFAMEKNSGAVCRVWYYLRNLLGLPLRHLQPKLIRNPVVVLFSYSLSPQVHLCPPISRLYSPLPPISSADLLYSGRLHPVGPKAH